MQVGVELPHTGPKASPEFIRDWCVLADEAGYGSLWGVDHMVMPQRTDSRYILPREPAAIGEDAVSALLAPNFELMTTLAYVAAITKRIRIGTAVAVLTIRNAVLNARQLATVDRYSGGRLLYGVGIGWLKEEADAMNMPWDRRGARARRAHRPSPGHLDRSWQARRVPRRVLGHPAHGPGTATGPAADPDLDRRPHRARHRAGRPPGRRLDRRRHVSRPTGRAPRAPARSHGAARPRSRLHVRLCDEHPSEPDRRRPQAIRRPRSPRRQGQASRPWTTSSGSRTTFFPRSADGSGVMADLHLGRYTATSSRRRPFTRRLTP